MIFSTCCLLIFHSFGLVLVRHMLTVEGISGSRTAVNEGTLRFTSLMLPTMSMSLLLITVLTVVPYDGGEIDSLSLSLSRAPGVNLLFYFTSDLRDLFCPGGRL